MHLLLELRVSNSGISETRQRSIESQRKKLISNSIAIIENNKLLFLKDHLFNTPSGASSTLIGYSSNGWVDWKNESGCTLDEIKRLE